MNYNLTIKTPPATEPLTLTEVKDYLRITDSDTAEDAYLVSLITAARQYCEEYQNSAFITQVWEMSMRCFANHEIEIPKGNLKTVDSITYKNSAGVITTLTANTDYISSIRGVVGRLVPAYGKSWPTFVPYPLDAVIITFTCGYGDASDVPARVKQAMKLLVSHWYENRIPIDNTRSEPKDIAFTLTALLRIDRLVVI